MNNSFDTNPTVLIVKAINSYRIPVVFLRHAEGENNNQKVFNTLLPDVYPLTNKGIEMAKKVKLPIHPNNEIKTLCVTSPFRRCYETACIIRNEMKNLCNNSDNFMIYKDDCMSEPKFYTTENQSFNLEYVMEYDQICGEDFTKNETNFGYVECGANIIKRYNDALQNAFDVAFAKNFNNLIVIGHYHTIRIMLNIMEGIFPFEARDIQMCIPYVPNIVEYPSYCILPPEKNTLCFRIPLIGANNRKDAENMAIEYIKTIIEQTPTTKTKKIDAQTLEVEDGKFEVVAILTKRYRFRAVDRTSFSEFIETAKKLYPETETMLFSKDGDRHYFITIGSYVGYTGQPVENEQSYPCEIKKCGAIRAIWLEKENDNNSTWGSYPKENIHSEPAFNGFVSFDKSGETIATSLKNQQECFTITNNMGTTYTICVSEKRAFNTSR